MTALNDRISAFAALGKTLKNLNPDEQDELFARARANNSWFTPGNISAAIHGISHYLQEEHLNAWTSQYAMRDQNKKVGIVMAGNIPMVGFHDLLCVVISGNQAYVKLSSQDITLITFIIDTLKSLAPDVAALVHLKERLKDIDAVIATGSDNTSRYFEYYFSKYPHIIRKNRTSCAILTGNETTEELKKLGDDIFLYFGLGCRNVSKLFVPEDYTFEKFYTAIEAHMDITHHHKYSNNYDYNKSIYLVNGEPHLDNGFLMLKEEKAMVSPISVVYYERYKNLEELKSILEGHKEKIQCIVSASGETPSKPFGEAQNPELWDYADGVDTMRFLTGL